MNIILWRIKFKYANIIWYIFQWLRKYYFYLTTGGKLTYVCYGEWIERSVKPYNIKYDNGDNLLYLKCPKCEKITLYDDLVDNCKEYLTCAHCGYQTDWRFSSDFNYIILE